MRKRKVIAIIVIGLLVAGIGVFLLTRDTGPPVVVYGNFTTKDVAQIKSAVRREVWREAFPDFSWKTIKASPRSVRWALRRHLKSISGPLTVNGTTGAQVRLRGPEEPGASELGSPHGFIVTNGPNGWVFSRRFVYE
jgi:hypothetical protein